MQSMSQSPELSGGTGFSFEANVAAFYLACLLAESGAPGIENLVVCRVAVQQGSQNPMDDIIVGFENGNGVSARLGLQAKTTLRITDSKTSRPIRDVISRSWSTFKSPDFRLGYDRFGVAARKIEGSESDLVRLCEFAQESQTIEHFEKMFSPGGSASQKVTKVKGIMVALIEEAAGRTCSNDEIHQFLAHFVLVKFDFLHGGAVSPSVAINLVRHCLVSADVSNASLVWSHLCQLVRDSAGKAGEYNRPRLVREVSKVAKLEAALSLKGDLDTLTELAKSYLGSIQDDIGGTRLERASDLETKLVNSDFIEIKGLPGSGKSVLLKQAVQRAIEYDPVLFLKGDLIDGVSWPNFAAKHGLSNAKLEDLLVEIGSTGSAVFFIDAIDRVEKKHQLVVLDVMRTIAESPLLDDWRIVVSLRDSGIESLAIWTEGLLNQFKIGTVDVNALSDDEAEVLAKEQPHLKNLLLGSPEVREVVRRPFFAKILSQGINVGAGDSQVELRSEVDLIKSWWSRGGYNAIEQNRIDRQCAIVELAERQAQSLAKPIRLRNLSSTTTDLIHQLVSDGILNHVQFGHTVRFAHDIFFEWAFYQVLVGEGDNWLQAIQKCGEPPAVARIVELLSQSKYMDESVSDWEKYLEQASSSQMRSQWERAWLLGPFGISQFTANEKQFTNVAFNNDFQYLEKALTWFQAEKTTLNTNVLLSDLPEDQKLLFDDQFAWLSDITAWLRLTVFLLRRISKIPVWLHPRVVSIFEVWQNSIGNGSNSLSHAVLEQCSQWLCEHDALSAATQSDDNYFKWEGLPNKRGFYKSLSMLILRAAQSEPSFTTEYLQRLISLEGLRKEIYEQVVLFSPTLAQSHPQLLVEFTFSYLKKELPGEQVARDKAEAQRHAERRNKILAKPELKRTRREKATLSMPTSLGYKDFSIFKWDNLCIDDHASYFYPSSPIREPFHSLFQSSPYEALRLLKELCNHAITAWQQLHQYTRNEKGAPIALEIIFPWGAQRFWGNNEVYLWCRGIWGPKTIACGFMALEEWCLAELDQGRSVDELMKQVIEGNECIAILGIGAMIALHSQALSEAIFPLITSQRLLQADHGRMVQDWQGATANLIGFNGKNDQKHIEAIQNSSARQVRSKQLSGLIPCYFFGGERFSTRTKEAVLDFKNNLPFEYEEQRADEGAKKELTDQALKFAELVDADNYRYGKTDVPGQVEITHESPSASKPEEREKAENARCNLQLVALRNWVEKAFETGSIDGAYTVRDAIDIAQKVDREDLFEVNDGSFELEMCQSAVAAIAAVSLKFCQSGSEDDLNWARNVLSRAVLRPERFGSTWSPNAVIDWHPLTFVARGLAADLCAGKNEAIRDLLNLVAHPLESVALAALCEICQLWNIAPRLVWSALQLGFSLCHVQPNSSRNYNEPIHAQEVISQACSKAMRFYFDESGWSPLPLPPPAWIKLDAGEENGARSRYKSYEEDDLINPNEVWVEPVVFWYTEYAAKILPYMPLENILSSEVRGIFIEFLTGLLNWTIQKIAPTWIKTDHKVQECTELLTWICQLGTMFGRASEFICFKEVKSLFLDSIIELEDNVCLPFLASFADAYVSISIYDAESVSDDAVKVLHCCLDRLLTSRKFVCGTYRSEMIFEYDQVSLINTLMFVSIDHAPLAVRYVNGDWGEIDRIIPVINRFVRSAGWISSVMQAFLTLCERSRASYPADEFADQILTVIDFGAEELKGWHGSSIYARIAFLVKYFADRDSPMPLALRQKLLRILDFLVDMGDRRSAALQLSETFREVRIDTDVASN